MELVSFINEFCCSAKTMHWISGPTLFEEFPMHLQVSDLDNWNIIIINAAQTMVGFTAYLDYLKRSKFLEDAYDRQVNFLPLIKKPNEMEPSAFNTALLFYHNILLAELPGAPADSHEAKFLDTDMRQLFLHSMPNAWQDKFEDASKTTHNTTSLHDIQD
jgi:hypothetical protein